MRRLKLRQMAWLGGVLLSAILLAGISVPSLAVAGEGPTTHRIVIKRFAFVPASIEIRPGDRVEWLNQDIVPHTASDVEGDWDTEKLTKGMVATVTFAEPGTQAYFCAFHPNMRGEIIVVEP